MVETIQVIDNLIPDNIRDDVWKSLIENNRTTGFMFGAYGDENYQEEQFWKMWIWQCSNVRPIKKLFDFINFKKYGGSLNLTRIQNPDGGEYSNIYVNGQTMNQEGTIHQDSDDVNSLTILYYPILLNHNPDNFFWDIHWGGETIFYNNDKDEIIKTVLPKPNRLVVFPGVIPHRGSAPTKLMPSNQLRLSLAFKCTLRR